MADGALDHAVAFLDVLSLVTAGRREDQWFPAYGRMRGDTKTCPGRGAASFTMRRRAGTHRQSAEHGPRISSAPRRESGALRSIRGSKHTSAIPRRIAPELCINDRPDKGRGATPRGERGMPGARCTRSRAWWVVNARVSHHGRTGITRHSRTRMVLTGAFVLSLVT